MALVTKNDVTQIFAIQAPEIDLPPAFANYPRGWDTARANNGKPTIKQFNYIQQRTDQNVLWIHQNGAALPYDATMEYVEGAVVVKDGVLQQWKSGSWVKVVQWSSIENKPTTVAGYGITDTYTKTEVNNAFVESTQTASTTQAGIVQLVDDLITGGIDKALTAEQGKLLIGMFANSKTANGYQKLPGGLIFQWGRFVQADSDSSKPYSWTLPIAFPNAGLCAFGSLANYVDGVVVPRITTEQISNNTVSGFTIGSAVNRAYRIFAIGF